VWGYPIGPEVESTDNWVGSAFGALVTGEASPGMGSDSLLGRPAPGPVHSLALPREVDLTDPLGQLE